ncbi:TlpA family protein disulfide reductase [Capnocytophaga canis]|uniref:Putative Thiol-disulfide isomerase-like thioredoxin n=1 Tax=Capnocytophaga canis TaxID=1848903 RepID=A0A0B7IQH3_9FLAO|nr:TlpA disulfide reductase family protein [Capnocytophaga canis]CEN54090.1 putative Thiol-disulfide isomerase-like thioredoxin [Capnocytophaga canis]
MKKFIVFISLIILISCSDQNNSIAEQIKTNSSVLILKKFHPTEKYYFSKYHYTLTLDAPVEVINPNSFIRQKYTNFKGNSDTISITNESKVMIAKVTHSPFISNTYYLKAGDTLVVDFSDLRNIKEYYQSKNALQGDIEPIYVKDSIDIQVMFSNDKQQRKANHLKDSLRLVENERKLDSLFAQNLVTSFIYDARKLSYFYSRKTKNIDINDESHLKHDSIIGIRAYQSYVKSFTAKKFTIKLTSSDYEVFYEPLSMFDAVYDSNFYGENVKEFLLYESLKNMQHKTSFTDVKLRLDKFNKVTKDSLLITELKNSFLLDFDELITDKNNIHFIDYQKQTTTLSKLLEANQGKVVYVDFWASWCIPCRKQMPFSKKLHHKYGDKVVFVYISIDTDFDKWQKVVAEEQLAIDGNNLFAVNYPKANFYKELNLSSIPRYLLFDKQGKLVHKNAPQPDSQEIQKELEELLE